MCTLTIVRDADRLLVTMNRDDIAERQEARPSLWPNAEPAFAAPKDLQAGGTWIGVNAQGVIACLLNRYDTAPVGRSSRGRIVIEAMGERAVSAACARLTSLDHGAYSPFTCLVLDRHSGSRLDWTGSSFEHTALDADAGAMVTSSSWQYEYVRSQREALFQTIWSSPQHLDDRIAAFHSERTTANDAWAPMMQRTHSQTKSVTQVELSPHFAEMRYWTRETAIERKLTAPDASVRIFASLPGLSAP